MGVSLDSADELIAHWRRTSMQARPDNYRHVPFQTFFRARLLAYVVPFAAFGDAIKNAVPPNYSPVERSYYHIVKWSLATTTAVVMLILMSALALCASNAAVSHSVSEIASIILIVIGSVLAPQAAREAGFASTTGVALQHEAARALSRLRAAEFELTCGEVISGFSSLIRATHSCANVPLPLARQFLFENTKLSPLAYSQKQSSEESQTRRRVSLAADELSALIAADVEHDADDHGARTSDKYEVYSCAPDRFFPWANALVMASAPTVTRVLQGEVSMFDSDSTVIDTLVGLLVVIGLLLSCCFSTLVVLKGAVDEMQCLDGWCKFTVGSITKGFMKNHKTSDNGGFHLRLDTMDAVRSFGSLHSAVKSTAMYVSTFHKAPFECYSVLCVVCVGSIFVGSLLDGGVEVWNVLLTMVGMSSLAAMLQVFRKIIAVDTMLDQATRQGLLYQRRMNSELVMQDRARDGQGLLSTKNVRDLQEANEAIDALCCEISATHTTPKLYKVLPLTKANLTKLAAAIATGIFTTVVRQSLPNY